MKLQFYRSVPCGLVVSACLVLATLGCSSSDSPSAAGEASDGGFAGAAGSSAGGAGGARGSRAAAGSPSIPMGAEGWKSAFSSSAGKAKCGSSKPEFGALQAVTIGESVIYVGYRQASANNKIPLVARFDGDALAWCKEHETQGPDSEPLGLTWNGGDSVYVVYSTDGGGSDLEGKGGWLSSYAPGAISAGGPKVSVLGKVNGASGAP